MGLLSIEAELNYFPRELTRIPATCSSGLICPKAPTVPAIADGRIQGLFGAKAGMRWGRIGIFGKTRAGFFHFRNRLQVVCVTGPCPPLSSSSTEPALDVGGVLELYPSKKVLVRFDLGDTYVRGTGIDLIPLALRVPHKLIHSNKIDWFIAKQYSSQCNILEALEPA